MNGLGFALAKCWYAYCETSLFYMAKCLSIGKQKKAVNLINIHEVLIDFNDSFLKY